MELPPIVVTQGAIPISLQLKEQFKWLIATAQLRPGDLLPSVRDLSAQLGIARNTINAVYDELRDEGLITMGRGRGTEVAGTPEVQQLARLAELLSILDQAHDAALQMGFTAAEVASAAQVRAQLLLARNPESEPVTLVECDEHEIDYFARQIREVAGRPVRYMDLETYRKNPAAAGTSVVTSCFHCGTVCDMAPSDLPVTTLGAHPDMRFILRVAQLKPGTHVLFVGRSPGSGLWMQRAVAEAGMEHLQLASTGVHEPDLGRLLKRANVVYAAGSVLEAVAGRAPDPARVNRYDLTLDGSSLEALKRLAEKPAAPVR